MLLLVMGIIWCILSLQFTGLDFHDKENRNFSWVFASFVIVIVLFTAFLVLISICGICLSSIAAPNKWLLGLYAAGLFLLVIIPNMAEGASLLKI